MYAHYQAAELKSLLELKTGHAYPLPLNGDKAKLLKYYADMGFATSWPAKKWTDEQLVCFGPLEGIVAVNAGPGTGKTSVVNERAYRLRHERVCLLSYTNSAIDEIYRRMHEYPIRGMLGKRNFSKAITVTTADSLASHLLGQDAEDYDSTVKRASSLSSYPYLFSHIIVDECNDIDDLRGNLILNYFRRSGAKSLLLVGDPRQRLSSDAGLWYQSLLGRVQTISFTYTHRFLNADILALTNSLSRRRPQIHHELQNISPGLGGMTACELVISPNLAALAEFSRNKDIAVIGPSMSGNNRTSLLARRIYEGFKQHGVSCYWGTSSGSYSPRGVMFSTIHSAKGKEFDFVILFGMSNFPAMFPFSEPESCVFVAHTRARLRIIYISDSWFAPPLGVENRYISRLSVSLPIRAAEVARTWQPHKFLAQDVANDRNFAKLVSANGLSLRKSKLCDLRNGQPRCLEEIFGWPQLGAAAELVSESEFFRRVRLGELCCGFDDDGKLYCVEILPSNTELSAEAIRSAFALPLGAETSAERDQIANICGTLHWTHVSEPHGLVLASQTCVVACNEWFAWICALALGKKAIVATGTQILELESDQPKSRWLHAIAAYSQIRLTIEKLACLASQPNPELNAKLATWSQTAFLCDTEFARTLFDVAAVNVGDPYRSIVQRVRTYDLDFATKWLSVSEQTMREAAELEDVYDNFCSIEPPKGGVMYYFVCSRDVEWCPGRIAVNLAQAAKRAALRSGYLISGNCPKLTDLYEHLCDPLEWQTHLRPHTALSDALMLYELIRRGYLEIETCDITNEQAPE